VTRDEVARALGLDKVAERAEIRWEDLRGLGMEIGGRTGVVRRREFGEWMIARVR
jgi:hypothetical protein